MNCRQAYDMTMGFLDGNLNDIENAQLEQHLKECKSCSESFRELSNVMSYIEKTEIELPQDFEAGVMDKIKSLEVSRKKQTDTILAISYSMIALILSLLTIIIKIDIQEVSMYESIKMAGESISALSGLVFTICNVFAVLYNLLINGISVFMQIVIVIAKTYYYVIPVLLLMLLVIQRTCIMLIRQGD